MIPEFHDKRYIIEQFFSKFTFKSIVKEINKYLRNGKSRLALYNRLGEYLTNKFGEEFEISNVFEYIDDNDYFQINDKGARQLLKSMGYLYEEEKNNE